VSHPLAHITLGVAPTNTHHTWCHTNTHTPHSRQGPVHQGVQPAAAQGQAARLYPALQKGGVVCVRQNACVCVCVQHAVGVYMSNACMHAGRQAGRQRRARDTLTPALPHTRPRDACKHPAPVCTRMGCRSPAPARARAALTASRTRARQCWSQRSVRAWRVRRARAAHTRQRACMGPSCVPG
jgi:hypothetical protein